MTGKQEKDNVEAKKLHILAEVVAGGIGSLPCTVFYDASTPFMRKTIPLLFLLLPLTGACKKDTPAATIDFGPGEGIFYRDRQNYPMGKGDASDWVSDGQWQAQEKSLFSLDVPVNLDGPQAGGISYLSYFPNPVAPGGKGNFNLGNSLHGATANLIWVNKNYKIISNRKFPIAAGSGLVVQDSFPESTFPREHKYRLYYVLYKPDGTLVYKGHGDVFVHQQ
ncbi:hypothetical protein [Hymenobacter metallicola]|uniref:Uncharacterized protein n=1 Tax=Hymenobacter metallicola TaxID=2563114 RepID=A0A4Z0QBN7_9BACT|nr:hypothetical protein [Hymenobacter metallicola]TGE27094.1 hypothetical protein E5K02_11870 [Hymenobacter metallicola]